ncbi:MAG: helix-turn-helix domain-containing protein [Alphaproteobacteria bacterium]
MSAVTSTREITIGALARKTGAKVETVRYYERIGLMPAPPRAAGGHRRYGETQVRRLWFIRHARHLGFSLDDIRHLLRLVDENTLTCRDVHISASEHLSAIRGRIADLQRLERVLNDLVDRCDRGLTPDCPVIDALFEAPS